MAVVSIVCLCVFAALVAGVLIAIVHVERRTDHGDGPSDGGGGEGGDPRRPRPSPPRPSDGDPGWWPDFERQFADYAARHPFGETTRTRRQPTAH